MKNEVLDRHINKKPLSICFEMLFLLFLIATASSYTLRGTNPNQKRSIDDVPKGQLVITTQKRAELSQDPNDYVCGTWTMSSALWAKFFPPIYAFLGFWRADGNIRIKDPLGNVLVTLNLNGSLWHQYQDANDNMVGDLFLNGASLGFPGVLILTSRQTIVPMLFKAKTCQNFFTPSPPNLIASYSELVAPDLAVGYMDSYYMSTNSSTLGQVFSNEYFNANPEASSPFSVTVTYATGTSNYPAQEVQFSYTSITQTQATAMGWSGNVANFTSTRGFCAGRGAIPVEVFSSAQRQQYGL